MRRLVVASFLAFAPLPAAAQAQAPEAPIPLATFFRSPDVEDVRLSPSGRWLAMTVGGGTKRVALAVAPVDGSTPPVVAAQFSDADIAGARWVGDDRLVFRIVDERSAGHDQTFGPGLFSVSRDGSGVRTLIRPRWSWVRPATLIERDPLDPTHRLLAIPSDGSNEVIVAKPSFSATGDLVEIDALRLDVATGRTRSASVGRPADARGWLFDPRGEARVVITSRNGRTGVHWRAPGSDAWRQIADEPVLETTFTPVAVDGHGTLYVAAGADPAGVSMLHRFDFASGKPEAQPLLRTPGFSFDGELVLDSAGREAFGIRTTVDAVTTAWFQPRMKAIQKTVDERLPATANTIHCGRCDDPELVLVAAESDRDPGTWYLYRPKTDAWSLLGRARRDVDPKRMATLDHHRMTARDGLEIPVWVTMPPGKAAAPRPAVVLVHGGPWVRHGSWRWDADAQFLASRGYVVIEPEFRGSTGYGGRLFRAGWKQWGRAMQDDLADAVAWAAGKGWVDPKRVCIAGASYGGYATLMGLARHPDGYRCGVAWVAVSDPRLLMQNSWWSDIGAETRAHGLPRLIGDPVQDAAMLASVAPVERARDIRAPLLLAYGRDDRRVPLEHGTRMREALLAAGQDPEWVVYDGEGHGFQKPENRLDFYARMERFLARHLAP